VGVRAAVEHIVVSSAADKVCAAKAPYLVFARPGVNIIAESHGIRKIGVLAAFVRADDEIVALAAQEDVAYPGAGGDKVVARITCHGIDACAPVDLIIAGVAGKAVVALVAIETIVI